MPDLNPAKFSAGFRKKRRRPEKTSGSKILKNRDDKRLDHTQGNCLCAASSSSGAHSNLPVPIALAHLPNGLRAEPSQNISNLCPLPRRNQGACGSELIFLCNRVSKVFFLQSGLLSMVFMLLNVSACLRTAPQESSRTHGSCQNSSLKNCSKSKPKPAEDSVQKSRRSYGKLRRRYGKLRRNYGKLRRSYDVPFFDNSLQNIKILNNTCSTAQNLSSRLCKPAQLELYPSAPTS